MSSPITPKPSLRALSFILRHPETWPPSFQRWDYSWPWTCAVGLTQQTWHVGNAEMPEVFGISEEASRGIFYCSFPNHKPRISALREVTPEMVADRIDEFLANE